MAYEITNLTSGLYLGVFVGNSPIDALNSMARDAGYCSFAQQSAVVDCVAEDAANDFAVRAAMVDVATDGGGVFTCSIDDFANANDLDAEDVAEIVAAINLTGAFEGGGGASPVYTITMAI